MLFRFSVTAKERYSSNLTSERMEIPGTRRLQIVGQRKCRENIRSKGGKESIVRDCNGGAVMLIKGFH